jgi:hypothetical protein
VNKPRRPIPRPRPDLVRRPSAGFGWLDQALLVDGWLAQLGPDATAVLVLLALAADHHGASFYSRHRMANALNLSLQQVDVALDKLRHADLLAFMPWRKDAREGVWQLLPTPQLGSPRPRAGRTLDVRQILASLGLAPPEHVADEQRQPTAPNAGAE